MGLLGLDAEDIAQAVNDWRPGLTDRNKYLRLKGQMVIWSRPDLVDTHPQENGRRTVTTC